jgi:hypothetical protein
MLASVPTRSRSRSKPDREQGITVASAGQIGGRSGGRAASSSVATSRSQSLSGPASPRARLPNRINSTGS